MSMVERFRRPFAVAIAAGAAAVLVGCAQEAEQPTSAPVLPQTSAETSVGSASPTTTQRETAGVLDPYETGVSKNFGVEVSILSVATEQSSYGPLTVFTFQLLNSSDAIFEGFNFNVPVVTYGEAGLPAKHQNSIADDLGNGVQGAVPPGSRQTIKYGYAVDIAELNPAVVTIGSLIWQGDFTAFAR